MTRLLYTIAEIADLTPYTEKDIRLAITRNYTGSNTSRFQLPPLRAKRGKRGKYLVTHAAVTEWLELLPDA